MAMLASKPAYSAPSLGSSSSQTPVPYSATTSSYRNQPSASRAEHSVYASPTESEFSEVYDAPDAVRCGHSPSVPEDKANTARHWDEEKVGDWLKRINCAQYVDMFRRMTYRILCSDLG